VYEIEVEYYVLHEKNYLLRKTQIYII